MSGWGLLRTLIPFALILLPNMDQWTFRKAYGADERCSISTRDFDVHSKRSTQVDIATVVSTCPRVHLWGNLPGISASKVHLEPELPRDSTRLSASTSLR